MRLINYTKIVALLVILAICTPTCWGFTFASNSKLSSGKWVKVKVESDGVYEITPEELQAFGFSDPSKVRIFGTGGSALPEFFSDNYPVDDLSQVPVMRIDDKLCFHAKGAISTIIQSVAAGAPRYMPTVNPYSTNSYYFLTDKEYPEMLIETKESLNIGYYIKKTSLNYVYHEMEETSIGSTGKTFLGEDFTSEKEITINFEINNPVADKKFIVSHSIAVNSNAATTITTKVNDDLVPFSRDHATIRMAESEYIYYNSIAPFAQFTPSVNKRNLAVNFKVESPGTIKTAKLDYVIVTYPQHNILPPTFAQLPIDQHNLSNFDKVIVTDSEEGGIIINVDNPNKPVRYTTKTSLVNDKYEMTCIPGFTSSFSKFIIFNPNRTLNKVKFVEVVGNQNLHAMSVPDMLIITTKDFIPQAQRIADYHKNVDNLEVAIIDHTIIFNEFSSGMPDATAYRRLAKMLWDKDPVKFKHLLLFGGGSYDNRKLIGNKGDNYLLTYQSNVSNDENRSYTTDDYFTFLEDNTGDNPPFNKMKINIGRMPVLSVMEAKNAVDKLLEFVNNKELKVWKNNILLIADQKDSGLHMVQSEGIETLIQENLGNGVQINKIYIEAFPLSNGLATSARAKMSSMLTQGQFFVTFIGHGGPRFLTKLTQLWRKEDVKNTPISNLPLFSLASCDVARFDSDTRGIAEDMFHRNGGGAIACMASARSVSANDNDILNRAFITNLFTPTESGEFRTVGEALRNAKLTFTNSNLNKLSFFLLGDPAMKLTHPKNRLTVKTINKSEAKGATIYPMSENIISGEILNADGTVNTNFNGNITATLYDKAIQYKNSTIIYPPGQTPKDINFQQDILSSTSGLVVNGVYTLNIVTPINCIALGEKVSLKLFAGDTATGEMVNGSENSIVMNAYDESRALVDNTPPTITAMYLNDTSFKEGDIVDGNCTLHLEFEDNVGINSKSVSIGQAMNLILDNKNSFPDIADHYRISENGKGGRIEFDISNLAFGKHSLRFNVSDLASNTTAHSISFSVENKEIIGELNVEEMPARDKATFTFTPDDNLDAPTVTIYITNDKGNKVWSKTTSSFPCEWDLYNTNGDRVAEGTYNFSGIISAGNQSGHTVTKKIIVIKQ